MDIKNRVKIIVLILVIIGVGFFLNSQFSGQFTFESASYEKGSADEQLNPRKATPVFVQASKIGECYFQFVEYRPSELEEYWFKASEKFKGNHTIDFFCNEMNIHLDWAHLWVKLAEEMMNKTWRTLPSSHPSYQNGTKIFSKFFHREHCNGIASKELRETWIEPLAFALRDPRWLCVSPKDFFNYLLNREYILLDQQEKKPQNSQNFYFDLGASTFSDGAGGPSQLYFYENYKKRNIKFDRMLLWEGTVIQPPRLFGEIPDEWIPGYQYFNILATVNETSPRNPLMIMKELAKPKDFVMFKLDIDNGPIEMSLIKQIDANPQYFSIIDEFFFEHHVAFQPLLTAWGSTHDSKATLRTSYELFTNFRNKGIRAHGWP